MSFFYSTEAGAVDFFILVAALVFGLYLGGRYTKIASLAMLGTFLWARTLVSFVPVENIALFQFPAEFVAMLAVLETTKGKIFRCFAALYAIDLMIYSATSSGFLTYTQMGNATTVILYFQMLLIIGGGVNDGFLDTTGRRDRHGVASRLTDTLLLRRKAK